MNNGIRSSVYLTEQIRNKLRLKKLSLSKAITETVNRYTMLINPIKESILEMFTEEDWKEILFFADRDWEAQALSAEFGRMLLDMQEYTKPFVIKQDIYNKLKDFTMLEQFAFVELIEYKIDSRMPTNII